MQRNTYQDWLKATRQGDVPQDFAREVMARVQELDAARRATSAGHRWAQGWGGYGLLLRVVLSLSLSALGVFRLSSVALTLLMP